MKKLLTTAISFLMILILGGCILSSNSDVDAAIKLLKVPESVTSDFQLETLIDDVTISYFVESDAIRLGSADEGYQSFLVTRQIEDVTVTIKATFFYGDSGKAKSYSVLVLKKDSTNINEASFTLTENIYDENVLNSSYRYAISEDNSDISYSSNLTNYEYIAHERGSKYYYYDDNGDLVEDEGLYEYSFYDFASSIINSFSDSNEISLLNSLFTNTNNQYEAHFKVDFKSYYDATGNYSNTTAFDFYNSLLKEINNEFDLQIIIDALKSAETNTSTYQEMFDVLFSYIPRSLFIAFNSVIYYDLADLFYYLIPDGDIYGLLDSSLTGYFLEDVIMLYGKEFTYSAYEEKLFSRFEQILKNNSILDYLELSEEEYLDYYDMSGLVSKYEITVSISLDDSRLETAIIDEKHQYTTAGQVYFDDLIVKTEFVASKYGDTELIDLNGSQYHSFASVKEELDHLIPMELNEAILLPADFFPYSVDYQTVSENLTISDTSFGILVSPTQSVSDITVILTAIISLNDMVESYDYSITILGAASLLEAAENELKALMILTLNDKFALPIELQGGDVLVSYTSSNTDAMKIEVIDGDQYIVAYLTDSSLTVTLTATLSDASNSDSKIVTFTITIPKKVTENEYQPNPNHSNSELYQETLMGLDGFVGLPTNTVQSPNEIINQNILIIPVEFSDYKFDSDYDSTIKTGFFGTEEATGWESVKTYYQKSSYGKIVFNGHVTTKFQVNSTSASYNKAHGEDMPQELIADALDYFADKLDFSQFDINDDEVIDGIYLVYSSPYYSNSNFWAWQHYYYGEETWNNVYAGYYVWASYDFFEEPLLTYQSSEDYYVDVNAQTFIHETGHMFGLMDYYDSGDGLDGGLGGYDMMDGNAGDHNSFSKLMMGWYTPQVVTNSIIVTIKPFVEAGEALLIPAGTWNNNYYSEYLMVEYYTPTSLNQPFADGYYQFGIPGVRIFHVDAEYFGDVRNDGYWYFHKYDNQETAHKLIKYVEADGDNSIEKTGWADDDDLFLAGDMLSNYSWYNTYGGVKKAPFTISVLSLTDLGATIQITFN